MVVSLEVPLPKQDWFLMGMSTKRLENWLCDFFVLRCQCDPMLEVVLHGEGQQGCKSMVGQAETKLEFGKHASLAGQLALGN